MITARIQAIQPKEYSDHVIYTNYNFLCAKGEVKETKYVTGQNQIYSTITLYIHIKKVIITR